MFKDIDGSRLQWVKWYPEWMGFGFHKTKPIDGMYVVYSWFLWLGFWELRCFIKSSDISTRITKHNEANA